MKLDYRSNVVDISVRRPYLTDAEKADLALNPIPNLHNEGVEQSRVDELAAMPWRQLVAHCDAIRASHRQSEDVA